VKVRIEPLGGVWAVRQAALGTIVLLAFGPSCSAETAAPAATAPLRARVITIIAGDTIKVEIEGRFECDRLDDYLKLRSDPR